MSAVMRKKRRLVAIGYLTAVGALLVAQASSARADSALCLAKVTSYVAELDVLLLEVRNRLTPYNELSERYFPLRDCEADALLDVVRRSRFIRSISHDARTNAYFIRLSNNDVLVSFTYYVAEKKTNPGIYNTGWVNK
jgi:hypothetical protein